MATTRKPAQQKPLEQQIECAKARAKTSKIDLVSIYADGEGSVTWTVTSACSDAWYHITYGADNHLTCDCPATVVCKHIGLVLNRNVDYTRKSRPAPTPAAPADASEAAIEASDDFNADYDAWLDSLPGDELAFALWLEQETAKLEQAAARRSTALPYDTGLGFSIFKLEDHNGEYIPSDHYSHAYR